MMIIIFHLKQNEKGNRMINIHKALLVVLLGFTLMTAQLSAKTAATVNGLKITVADANKALKVLTKGEKTWKTLPKDGKQQLIEMMAPSKLVAYVASKELTQKEKQTALSGFWMQKKMAKVKISDKEAKKAYNKMLNASKKMKGKEKIPPFSKIKGSLKMQLAQEKVISSVMKKAKIKLK
ncbi:MAG: Cell binding factor 2 [uncultured Sulfurovum sp.]|uniref:Cell binding factor 2 n=1 Tax=uncultured Sulfurovum sp. TaxID=269237 RepID=A0A6S6SAI7_9BACT|nr:MAG: Cell binding factor 2 [uncultured Sulfurovum sp.]